MLKRLKKLAFALAGTVALCGSMSAQALNFSQIDNIYFFGDSLTDSGFNDNYPTGYAGKAPTFTTYGGYIYSQYLARDIKGFVLPIYPGPVPADTITNNQVFFGAGDPLVSGTKAGIDYAAGGSTTNSTGNGIPAPSLLQQINFYLATAPERLDPRNLYFIWSGANDLLVLLNNPTLPTQLQLLTAANTAANNIGTAVSELSARGARRIVVMSLPNIGFTPLIQEAAAARNLPTLPADMKTISFAFNSMLNTQLGRVIKRYGTSVLYVDVYDMLDAVIAATKAGRPYVVAGQSFQFVNYNSPACGLGVSALNCPPGTPQGYIFADTLHPTDMAHRVLSLQIEQLILAWNPNGGHDDDLV